MDLGKPLKIKRFSIYGGTHITSASNTDENIEFLTEILSYFQDMKNKYGMKSLNMGEISTLIQD